MRPMRLLALLALTVGCGGATPAAAPPPAPDPIPETAGPDCGVVADKLAIVVHADAPDAQAGATSQLRARCTADRWSDEARNCFATAQSDAEIDGCRAHLDEAQNAALAKVAPAHDAWGTPPGAPPAAAVPAEAPAVDTMAPATPRRATRGAQTGGDATSDPQEGGE